MIDYINIQYSKNLSDSSDSNISGSVNDSVDSFWFKLLNILKLLLYDFEGGLEYISGEVGDLFNNLFINNAKTNYINNLNPTLLNINNNNNIKPIFNKNDYLYNIKN
jgi:hypothetical protein